MREAKIVTDSIKDQIYQILKEDILTGELRSGEQLVEQTIAARFNTSRSPVREAIKQLTGDGLVINITNKGTFVKTPTIAELHDIQEMRQVLEVFAVKKTIQHLSDSAKSELMRLRQRIIDSRDLHGPNLYLDLERSTWIAIIRMTNNSYVIDTYCKLYAIVTNFSKSVIPHMEPSFEHSVEERIAIIDALLGGDTDTAVNITERHLQNSTRILCEALTHLQSAKK